MKFLDQFNYMMTGPEMGRKWIFLHGLMGSLSNWRRIIYYLEKTERVLVFDQRGHGRSFQPKIDDEGIGYRPEDYANDLKHITDELGWDQFVLVGHSMGGRNALNFSSRFPDKVSHLVIEDIHPGGDGEVPTDFVGLLGSIPTPFLSREEAKHFFNHHFENKVLGQFLYANLNQASDGKMDWRFYKEGIIESVVQGRKNNRWNELVSLKMPTLVMRGQNSKELSSVTFKKMVESNKMIKGVEIFNAGHWIHSEQPKAFLSAIQEFIGIQNSINEEL